MNNLEKYIIEKLKINKNSQSKQNSNISNQWEDKDEWTKYRFDALYNIFNLIKDKVNWESKQDIQWRINFNTSLNKEDIKELSVQIYTNRYLDYSEYQYDWKNFSYLKVNIFKEKLFEIHNYTQHPNKYDLTLENSAVDFYNKYYKNNI